MNGERTAIHLLLAWGIVLLVWRVLIACGVL